MQNITALVTAALATTLQLAEIEGILPGARLKEDLGLDSMSSLIFLMKLEETIAGFQIDPDTLDAEALATIASMTAYVTKQLQGSN